MVSLMFDWDLDAAERGFKRAMELSPGHIQGASWYHLFYLGFLSGRWNEAFEGLLALEKREPLSAYIASVLSIGHSAEGRDPAQALHWATRALELDPIAFNPLWARQLALAINGDLSKAIEAGDFALAMSGRAPLALPPLAVALVENGEMDHARSVYEEMRSRSRRDVFAPTGMAAVAAALGDNEAAIEFAREAFRRHDPQLPIISTSFRYGQYLRALPEFQEIVKTLKLPGWNPARAGDLRTGRS